MFAGVLELKSVKPGHIAIKGKSTSLFLCLDSGGHLKGQVQKRKTQRTVSLCPFPSFTYSLHLLSHSGALHGGWLHLQRTAAGRWIHSFPFLTPRISRVSGIKTNPRPTGCPLHSIPATQEYIGRGECVWTTTKQSEIFQHGLWRSSWNGSKCYDQSTVLSGQVMHYVLLLEFLMTR